METLSLYLFEIIQTFQRIKDNTRLEIVFCLEINAHAAHTCTMKEKYQYYFASQAVLTTLRCQNERRLHIKIIAIKSQNIFEGPEWGVPIPFPSSFFFQIPFCNSQIPFLFLIFNLFFPFPKAKAQSQCGLNPIFLWKNLLPIPILPLQNPHI